MTMLMELCKNRTTQFYKMRSEIDYIIDVYKVKSSSEMTQEDKYEVAGYLLDALSDNVEWLGECSNMKEIMASLSKYMISNDPKDRDQFLTEIRDAAFTYHQQHIDDYIDQRLNSSEDYSDDAIEMAMYSLKIGEHYNRI
jgi:hypothetical protein